MLVVSVLLQMQGAFLQGSAKDLGKDLLSPL